MNKMDNWPEIDWSSPVEEQELERMRDFARLPLGEKLAWLEEAQRFVEHMKARRALRLQTHTEL